MELLRLENEHLKRKIQTLRDIKERAKSKAADHIYWANLEKEYLLEKIKFLAAQISRLTSELHSLQAESPKPLEGSQMSLQIDEGGEVKAGTLETLVQHLYSTSSDNMYMTVFLLTYKAFATPKEVLDQLITAYKSLVADTSNSESLKCRLKIGSFMKKWIENNYEDFTGDSQLLEKYGTFVTTIVVRHDSLLGNSLKNAHAARSKGVSRRGSSAVFSNPPPAQILPKEAFSLLFIDPLEIARQLTLLDYDLCRQIEPKEFLGMAWTKEDKWERAPNLMKMIQRFNLISKWCAFNLLSETNLKKRSSILSHLLAVLQNLHELNNFNAMFQMLGGLGNSSVHRLTKTFALLKPDKKKILEDMRVLTNSQKSWSNYRHTIHGINPPCIPFFGVYQTDLTFIEEGNPSKFSSGLINYKKCRMISNVIMEIQQYQQKPYNLREASTLQDWLNQGVRAADQLDDKKLYELSLLAEPRAQ